MALDKSKYLRRVLNSYKMSYVQDKMDKYIKKREEVKDALDEKYNGKKVTKAIFDKLSIVSPDLVYEGTGCWSPAFKAANL